MEKMCPVCDYPFSDGDKLVAVMLSEYKSINSEVHYAIATPTQCVEIVHRDCYDFPNGESPDEPHYMGGDSNS